MPSVARDGGGQFARGRSGVVERVHRVDTDAAEAAEDLERLDLAATQLPEGIPGLSPEVEPPDAVELWRGDVGLDRPRPSRRRSRG